MDSTLRVSKDGTGRYFAIDALGIKKEVFPADLWSSIRAANLGPGQSIEVETNRYSALDSSLLSSTAPGSCISFKR